jgi:hypothetical protein
MRVMNPSAEDLRAERKRLLARAHAASVKELNDRAARGGLSADEYSLWEEIRSIEYLLGEEDDAVADE